MILNRQQGEMSTVSIPAKNSAWRNQELAMTPWREERLTKNTASHKANSTHANTFVDVSDDPTKLVEIPHWKNALLPGRLFKVIGTRVRIVDSNEPTSKPLVRDPKTGKTSVAAPPGVDYQAELEQLPLAERLQVQNARNPKTGSRGPHPKDPIHRHQTANKKNKVSDGYRTIFVKEGVLTDLEWTGSHATARVQIDHRWYDLTVDDPMLSNVDGGADTANKTYRRIYMVEDLLQVPVAHELGMNNSGNEAAHDEESTYVDTAEQHTCDYKVACLHKKAQEKKEREREHRKELRERHPRTLAFASWK